MYTTALFSDAHSDIRSHTGRDVGSEERFEVPRLVLGVVGIRTGWPDMLLPTTDNYSEGDEDRRITAQNPLSQPDGGRA